MCIGILLVQNVIQEGFFYFTFYLSKQRKLTNKTKLLLKFVKIM